MRDPAGIFNNRMGNILYYSVDIDNINTKGDNC